MVKGTQELTHLKALVNDVLAPHRSFYRYSQANEYAQEADDAVDLLVETATTSPSVGLLRIIERALALMVRTILRSDDSSGLQGDQIRTVLEAHATAARGVADELAAKDRRRLADWLVKFRYGGTQDFFDPDIVAYAPALKDDGVARYRAALADIDLGEYGRYPLQRLAVLDADAGAIVAAHGGEPTNALVAQRLVDDLVEAGLQNEALRYARLGLTLPAAERAMPLVDLLVTDAIDRGDPDAALKLRRDHLMRYPDGTAFTALMRTAHDLGRADAERASAEALLREGNGRDFLGHLLRAGRDEEAWSHAVEHPDDAAYQWTTLLERRAQTHPGETLPYHREVVTSILEVTGRQSYHAAAKQLLAMRAAAKAAGQPRVFDQFLAQTREANKRRPTFAEILARHRVTPLG